MGAAAQGPTGEVAGLPLVRRVFRVALLEHGPDELTVVAGSGRAHLPEVRGGHRLERGAGGAELGSMEQRFPGHQLVQDVGVLPGAHAGHCAPLPGDRTDGTDPSAALISRTHLGLSSAASVVLGGKICAADSGESVRARRAALWRGTLRAA